MACGHIDHVACPMQRNPIWSRQAFYHSDTQESHMDILLVEDDEGNRTVILEFLTVLTLLCQ